MTDQSTEETRNPAKKDLIRFGALAGAAVSLAAAGLLIDTKPQSPFRAALAANPPTGEIALVVDTSLHVLKADDFGKENVISRQFLTGVKPSNPIWISKDEVAFVGGLTTLPPALAAMQTEVQKQGYYPGSIVQVSDGVWILNVRTGESTCVFHPYDNLGPNARAIFGNVEQEDLQRSHGIFQTYQTEDGKNQSHIVYRDLATIAIQDVAVDSSFQPFVKIASTWYKLDVAAHDLQPARGTPRDLVYEQVTSPDGRYTVDYTVAITDKNCKETIRTGIPLALDPAWATLSLPPARKRAPKE